MSMAGNIPTMSCENVSESLDYIQYKPLERIFGM